MAELWAGGPIELPHTFTIDDVPLEIPQIPTATLLGWLARGTWMRLIPEAIEPMSMLPLLMRFADDRDVFDFEHLWDPAVTLLGRLAGMHSPDGSGTGWWPAVRLAATATAHWPVYTAWCAGRGTGPLDGPLWRVVGSIYGWLRSSREGSEQELAKLDQQIWTPPVIQHATEPEQLPRHVREEEAKLALAALNETMPGEDRVTEWRPHD